MEGPEEKVEKNIKNIQQNKTKNNDENKKNIHKKPEKQKNRKC